MKLITKTMVTICAIVVYLIAVVALLPLTIILHAIKALVLVPLRMVKIIYGKEDVNTRTSKKVI